MADGESPSAIGKIVQCSRARNPGRDITGALVFDGEYFCQHLEGPRTAVLTLMEEIRRDPRHVDVDLLHEAALGLRRHARFSMGYAASDEMNEVRSIAGLKGEAAMARFLALLPDFDMRD